MSIFPESPRGRAWLATLALIALSAPALGATLILTGTPGATVAIDGDTIGRLPLDEPLEVRNGRHVVTATLKGMQDMESGFMVRGGGQVVRVHLRMMPLSRREAVLTSALLAGSGQRTLGRDRLGWVLTAVELGGLLTAVVSDLSAQNHKDNYQLALDNYDDAYLADDIARYRAEVEEEHASMQDALDLRNAALAAAGGAVVISVLDALLRFPSVDAGPGMKPAPPPGHASLAAPRSNHGFHVGLRLAF